MNKFRALTLACAAVVIMSTAAAANETERYLVEFADQRSEQGLAALLNAGGAVRRQLTHLNAVAVELPTQALAGLESNPNFLRIAVDPKRYPLSLDNLELPVLRCRDVKSEHGRTLLWSRRRVDCRI